MHKNWSKSLYVLKHPEDDTFLNVYLKPLSRVLQLLALMYKSLHIWSCLEIQKQAQCLNLTNKSTIFQWDIVAHSQVCQQLRTGRVEAPSDPLCYFLTYKVQCVRTLVMPLFSISVSQMQPCPSFSIFQSHPDVIYPNSKTFGHRALPLDEHWSSDTETEVWQQSCAALAC